ncbi:hypothetical protein MZ16F84_40730 [Escherichia coli]|uniref:hypothetical protein n=1 Tax=Escherichia coli TaxID=562 RepID=UPI003965DFD8|nr:hypothetical protein [Escherichia coli]
MNGRNEKGQFTPGYAGGPGGARKRKTSEQKLLEAIAAHAPAVVEKALVAAQNDNAVLAAVMNYLAESMRFKNLQFEAELQAVTYAAASGGVRH